MMKLIKRFTFGVALLVATAVAQAQIYQWQDANKKTVISDRPPPSSSAQQQKKYSAETPEAAAANAPSLADREMDFRKRQKDAREQAEKSEAEQRAANDRQEACVTARRALQVLESGERVALRNSAGERYYLDDTQRAAEIERTRQAVQTNCRANPVR